MRRILGLCILVAMLFSLFACSEEGGIKHNDVPTQVDTPVYKEYSNLVRIGQFHNGLAPFVIYVSNSNSHWGTAGSWNGDYFFGYINIKGEIVIEPQFECSPYMELPKFEYNYTKVTDLDNNEFIIDKKGNVQFKAGESNVSAVGSVSQGYFWVEVVTEKVSGNEYTVEYYSANDLSVVATFENVRAVPDSMWFNGDKKHQTTLGEDGQGLLLHGSELKTSFVKEEDMLYIDIADYDSNFKPSEPWKIDIESVKEISSAAWVFYCVSGQHNDQGRIATVQMVNGNGNWFYAIVDSNGKCLLEPQQGIQFPVDTSNNSNRERSIRRYNFCKNLCPALDAESGYWGYVDPEGNWVISPAYSSAEAFSQEGYATVNEKIVINTEGKIVLAPAGWKNEIIQELSGTYRWEDGELSGAWYISFYSDGTMKITEIESGMTSSYSGQYKIKGSKLILSHEGFILFCPIQYNGENTIKMEGDTLYIGETKWVPSNAVS